jgi:hypothetical protein
VARHAALVLGVAPTSLRVTSQSELQGEEHDFYYVVAESGATLVVVVPRGGEPFDARTPDAFTRVARAEQSTARLSKLGAERVASWFGTLGGGVCPPPPVDQAHFATVTRREGGEVELTYPVGVDRARAVERTCVIELAADGSLKAARTMEVSAPRAGTQWHGTVE